MIRPGEVQQKTNAAGVRDQQIEKDYIISWILYGISNHEHLSQSIVFKGGTVLKKAYFKDYRFSEDLDFTLIDAEIIDKQIFQWFKEVFEFVKDEANIPLYIIDDNKHIDGGINFYISYIGPLGGQGHNKTVKVDISRSEQLVFEPKVNNIFVDYSDLSKHQILCYTLEEVLVEKMRSVMQRMQARDLYDIWYLLEKHEMEVDFYLREFETKCSSKGLMHTEFLQKLDERLSQYKGRWKKSLGDQIKNIPEFEQIQREVKRHLKKLNF